MSVEIKVPVLPESVSDATIATWHKKPGEKVSRDENLVDIETDKVVLEVVAPDDGVIDEILKHEGDTVTAQEVIATFKSGADAEKVEDKKEEKVEDQRVKKEKTQVEEKDFDKEKQDTEKTKYKEKEEEISKDLSPAVRRLIKEHDLNPKDIKGSGKDGKITKEDVEEHLTKSPTEDKKQGTLEPKEKASSEEREEKRVPMSRLRARIAERLLEAQRNAAILTTFNEINMQPVMDLRTKYKDKFEKEHGIKLGFMSFFTMAAVEALKRFPEVNASIDGNDIVYHGYFDIGIAVSTSRGLVVPILRDADTLSMAEIERKIKDFGQKAQKGQLTIEEMTGGTFTISNGGIFGSLMATPILNPPQSGILGMHKIEERPVVENGQIVIRPMMYVALSYDHRIIDGRESVQFLLTIKEIIEDPSRLLLGI